LVFGLVLKGCDSLFRLELYATKKPINFGLISGFLSVFVSLSSRNYDFSSLAINSIVNIIISIVFCAFLLMIRKVQRSKN
jgi:fluoride ion exporter CrcB/FEX